MKFEIASTHDYDQLIAGIAFYTYDEEPDSNIVIGYYTTSQDMNDIKFSSLQMYVDDVYYGNTSTLFQDESVVFEHGYFLAGVKREYSLNEANTELTEKYTYITRNKKNEEMEYEVISKISVDPDNVPVYATMAPFEQICDVGNYISWMYEVDKNIGDPGETREFHYGCDPISSTPFMGNTLYYIIAIIVIFLSAYSVRCTMTNRKLLRQNRGDPRASYESQMVENIQ